MGRQSSGPSLQHEQIKRATPRGDLERLCWSPAITSNWYNALSSSSVDPRWSPAATSGNATDDDLHQMCLDDPLATTTKLCAVPPQKPFVPKEDSEVSITKSTLRLKPAQCSETHEHMGLNRDNSYEVLMVPLESVWRSPTLPHLMGMRLNSHGLVQACQVVPKLARVNGHPPF